MQFEEVTAVNIKIVVFLDVSACTKQHGVRIQNT
jgi:hypothetical protein